MKYEERVHSFHQGVVVSITPTKAKVHPVGKNIGKGLEIILEKGFFF